MKKKVSTANAINCGAFSLVEVTMALGIVSFAVLSIVGMLPVGLSVLHDSKAQMLETLVLKDVTAQNAVGSFTSVGFTAWYDGEGQTVTDSSEALFKVVVDEASASPSFPGSNNAFQLASSLKAVRIAITDLRNQTQKTSYLMLANNGR